MLCYLYSKTLLPNNEYEYFLQVVSLYATKLTGGALENF